jgi:co-chaperonin GroES (HSP10)
MSLKTPQDRFLIEIKNPEKLSENLLMPIALGEDYNNFAPVYGTILARPLKFTKRPLPSWYRGRELTLQDLETAYEEIRLGDEVVLSYQASLPERLVDLGISETGNPVYSVDANLILAKKKGFGIQAVGGWCIILPEETTKFQSSLLIIPETMRNKKKNYGTVFSSSHYWSITFAHGDKVIYEEKSAEWIEIDEVKYDVVYNHEILAFV